MNEKPQAKVYDYNHYKTVLINRKEKIKIEKETKEKKKKVQAEIDAILNEVQKDINDVEKMTGGKLTYQNGVLKIDF